MSRLSPTRLTYFGKLPSRGDFVRVDHSHHLISAIDDWLTQTMERFAEDPRWKIGYDEAHPLHFALLGSRRKLVVAGHLVNSHDQSGRRFPFITASAIGIDDPLPFAARSPLALSRLWSRTEAFTRRVLAATDGSRELENAGDAEVSIEVDASTYNPHFKDFLEIQTLASLEKTLSDAGHKVNLANLFPALGQLLQPVLASGATRLQRGLVLPLPDDPMYRYPVATLWMDLVAPFLARAEIEIAVFVDAVAHGATLILGFSPTPAATLHSAMSPDVCARENIALLDPEWADTNDSNDYDLKKLASFLEQPGTSLRLARDTFREVFLGE